MGPAALRELIGGDVPAGELVRLARVDGLLRSVPADAREELELLGVLDRDSHRSRRSITMQVFDKSKATARPPGQRLLPGAVEARRPAAGERSAGSLDGVWLAARALGALSLLAVGAVHLQQYHNIYHAIPTIGTLFVLNFVGATTIGLALLTPVERLLGRWGDPVVALLALGGIAQAGTAFVLLLVSERTPLFGFMEPGYDPTAITASRVSEVATVALLGTFLAGRVATVAWRTRRA